MPRLGSLSSRPLTGIGISPPLPPPPLAVKTFDLLEADGFTAWYIPEDIGSANFNIAQGDIVQGYDDFGYWAQTGSDTAVLAATVPSATPTAFTAIIKCRLASPTLLSDIDIFFRGTGVPSGGERINYNTGFGRRGIQYNSAGGTGYGIVADDAVAGNPHLIITIRVQNSPRVQVLDIYNLNTGTLDLRFTETNYPGITNLTTATLMGFALGSTTYPLQFYEGATFNSYLSDTRLNEIYDTAAGIAFGGIAEFSTQTENVNTSNYQYEFFDSSGADFGFGTYTNLTTDDPALLELTGGRTITFNFNGESPLTVTLNSNTSSNETSVLLVWDGSAQGFSPPISITIPGATTVRIFSIAGSADDMLAALNTLSINDTFEWTSTLNAVPSQRYTARLMSTVQQIGPTWSFRIATVTRPGGGTYSEGYEINRIFIS